MQFTIRVNHTDVDRSHLDSLLLSLKKKHPLATPLLLSDQKAHFGTYLHIKGALEKAGFDKLHIAVEEENHP